MLAGEGAAEAQVRTLQGSALALDRACLRSAGEFTCHPDSVVIELFMVLHIY